MTSKLNVVQFKPISDEISADVDKQLKSAQKDCDKGELRGIAIAAIRHDGTIDTWISSSESLAALIGAAAYLEYRLKQDMDDICSYVEPEDGDTPESS